MGNKDNKKRAKAKKRKGDNLPSVKNKKKRKLEEKSQSRLVELQEQCQAPSEIQRKRLEEESHSRLIELQGQCQAPSEIQKKRLEEESHSRLVELQEKCQAPSDIQKKRLEEESHSRLVELQEKCQAPSDIQKKHLEEESHSRLVELQEQCQAPSEIDSDHELLTIGRRIVSVSHLFAELQRISDHGPLGCTINELKLIAEKKIGLRSKFTFRCSLCNLKFVIDSDDCYEDYVDLNRCAVAGTIAVGCGHSQLNELLTSLNLPTLEFNIYKNCHDACSKHWEQLLTESMLKAAEEEKKLALEAGRVTKNGIAIIDVIVDACWSRRSYKKNYNAPSGVAAIIGKQTGKILFLGIRNKYCSTCVFAEKKGKEISHQCYKNHEGPSTNMENEIIVEGFKASIEMYNLVYGRLVSDGDASTYAKILQARPYSDVTVQKIECRNHVLRNLCTKLQALSADTKYDSKNRKKITKTAILRTRAVICKAIKKHKENSDVFLLKEDILLSHLHGFGDHSRCKQYFCNKEGAVEETFSFLSQSALWTRICLLIQNVAGHSTSLIHDVDSNIVECYNSVVAKFVGGKRVNYSKRNSYQTRCHAAALSFNERSNLSLLYKAFNAGVSPRGKIIKFELNKARKNTLNLKRQKPKFRPAAMTKNTKDHNYGQNCLKPDLDTDIFEEAKLNFLSNLRKTEEQRKEIERNTILQGHCGEWVELRRSLLTASNFGKVINRKQSTSCENFVKNLLYKVSSIDNVESIKHGNDNEKIALNQLQKQEKITIEPCGLYIDEEYPFLGASPDGIIGTDMIVEIKCPITAFKMGIDKAIESKKVNFWKISKNEEELNKAHNWYYQVQGQLRITKRSKCLFGVWSGENNIIKTALIDRDDQFWETKMKKKLTDFYMDCILPEIIDPRYPRGLPIRNPQYIMDAVNNRTAKLKGKENLEPVDSVLSSISTQENLNATESSENEMVQDTDLPTCSRFLPFESF